MNVCFGYLTCRLHLTNFTKTYRYFSHFTTNCTSTYCVQRTAFISNNIQHAYYSFSSRRSSLKPQKPLKPTLWKIRQQKKKSSKDSARIRNVGNILYGRRTDSTPQRSFAKHAPNCKITNRTEVLHTTMVHVEYDLVS